MEGTMQPTIPEPQPTTTPTHQPATPHPAAPRPAAWTRDLAIREPIPRCLLVALLAGGALVTGCALAAAGGRSETAESRAGNSAGLTVAWRPVDHSANGAFFISELTLDNRGPRTLGAGGWPLYFNFVRRILADGEGDPTATQDLAGQGLRVAKPDDAAGGVFFVLEPLASFSPLAPGEQRTVTFL